jgi:ketosteroid isomerase-like protein
MTMNQTHFSFRSLGIALMAISFTLLGYTQAPKDASMNQPAKEATATSAINAILDGFHTAASKADGKTYFNYFHKDGVFLGTDKTERWSVEAFKAFAEPYFSKGKGWTYVSQKRHISLSANGQTAWFDEELHNEKYGNTRGSGVLVKEETQWKITQYVLSFPIPNAVAKDAIELIQAHEATTQKAP